MAEDDVILRLRLQGQLQVIAGLREAQRELSNVGGAQRHVSSETDEGAAAWSNWGFTAKAALAGAAYGVLQVAENIVSAGIGFNVLKENAQITFGVLLGSTAKAKALTADLFNLAQKSSFFRYQDVLQAAQSLLTFGFSARRIIPDLKTLANVASLHPERGSAGIEQLAIILGQIHQSGHLFGQDARQLQSLGIDVYTVLAKRLRETPALVLQQAQQGLISSKVAIDAIFDYANKKYHGLADRLSKSTGGKYSNLQDLLTAGAGALTLPLMPALNKGMDRLAAWLQKPSTTREIHQIGLEITKTAEAIAPLVVGGLKLLATFTGILGLPILRILQALAPEFKLLGDLMGAMADHSLLLALALGYIIGPLWATYEGIRLVNWALGPLVEAWKWLDKHATLYLHLHYSGPGSGVLGFLSGGHGGLGGLLAGATGIGTLMSLANMAGQAAGGVTTSPGWSWVGEKGRELLYTPQHAVVAPLEKAGGLLGQGGGDLYLTVQVEGRTLAEVFLENFDAMRARH